MPHSAYDPEHEVTEDMPAYMMEALIQLDHHENMRRYNLLEQEQRDTLPVMWGE